MKHVKLIVREDQSTGETGLVLEGLREIDYPMVSREGLQIAHDLLEHQQGTKKIGTIGDELIALGAIWYVRGQWGDLRRDSVGSAHSTEYHLASDVANMGSMYCLNGSRLHAKVPKRAPSCDAAETFRDVLRIAFTELRAELRDSGGLSGYRREVAQYLRAAYRLMCKGYNMAAYRFERRLKGSRYYANNLFWAIAEAIDDHTRYCEIGQEFLLSYGNGEARCREITDYEW